MTRILIAGCAGRMGRRIAALAHEHPKMQLSGGFETQTHDAIGKDLGTITGVGSLNIKVVASLEDCLEAGDVIIDFTAPQATMKILPVAVSKKKKMVIGTTGLSDADKEKISSASKEIPIVCAPNMGVGVNLVFKLSEMIASILSEEYDIEIVEAHHKHKKDAPSGTALEIARRAAKGRGINLNDKALYGREGLCGEREPGVIGIHAVRGGDVVGEHTISFMSEGERIELTHRASSRDVFAKGALVAALFVDQKENGLYSMQDVLGIE